MLDHLHYVPIIKWRQGEYQALYRLASSIKDFTTPLLEIPTEGWDFENEVPAKSLDDHLSAFGKRLKAKWGNRRCFVDSCYLDGDAIISTGKHHFEWIFELARNEGCAGIPVAGLSRHAGYLRAVKDIIQADKRGMCLRLESSHFDQAGLKAELSKLLKYLGVGEPEVDVIIDLRADVGQSVQTHALVLLALLKQLPSMARWRSVTVAGTAFPESLPSSIYRPTGKAKRTEWLGYKKLASMVPEDMRLPTFGDYSVSHPRTERLDPRMIDPLAKVKYTIKDEWFIVVGEKVKKYGRGQYVDLCKRIVRSSPPLFAGTTYSWGDEYIAGCASRSMSTGGASTWPSIGTNHHVTQVVRDLANFYGASVAP